MIRELNCNFAMHLDPTPDLSPTNNKLRKGQCFLLVGASNAGRTADALEQLGVNVLRAVIPGWRGLKMKVQPMVDLVRSKLKEAGPNCIVVHQLLDNSFYLAKTEEGGLIPAVRETIGGKYHVQGELVFAPKELQYSVFTTVKPIFDEASSHHQILISPLPRYLRDRCCSDLDHVANEEVVPSGIASLHARSESCLSGISVLRRRRRRHSGWQGAALTLAVAVFL